MNTILLEDVLQVSIRVVIFIGGPQTAQVGSRVFAIVQGTGGPLVFAVGDNTSLKFGHKTPIGIGMTRTYEGKTTTLVIGSANEYGLPILIVIHNGLEVSNDLMVLQNVV